MFNRCWIGFCAFSFATIIQRSLSLQIIISIISVFFFFSFLSCHQSWHRFTILRLIEYLDRCQVDKIGRNWKRKIDQSNSHSYSWLAHCKQVFLVVLLLIKLHLIRYLPSVAIDNNNILHWNYEPHYGAIWWVFAFVSVIKMLTTKNGLFKLYFMYMDCVFCCCCCIEHVLEASMLLNNKLYSCWTVNAIFMVTIFYY